jgi:hypothetical protein
MKNRRLSEASNQLIAWLILPGFLGLLAACSSGQHKMESESSSQHPDSFESTRYHQVIKINDGQDLEINNPFGDLHVRKGGAGSVELNLFVQRVDGSLLEGKINQEKTSEGIQLRIDIGDKDLRSELLRIDAVVLVPTKSILKLHTKDGDIDARKLDNPLLEVRSLSGELVLSSTALMHARTELGNIRASMMHPGWQGQHKLVSGSGKIQATFPLGPHLNLHAKAGKNITSEFELQIRKQGSQFVADFSSGDASDAIVIESHQGQVELFSAVFDPRIYGPASIVTPQPSPKE